MPIPNILFQKCFEKRNTLTLDFSRKNSSLVQNGCFLTKVNNIFCVAAEIQPILNKKD